LRGQDGTELDAEKKKKPGKGGIGTVRTQNKIKKSKGGALTRSCRTAQDMEKKKGASEGWSTTGQYMGKASKYGHSPMECLGRRGIGNSSGNGSCKGETRVVRTPGESKQVMHLPAQEGGGIIPGGCEAGL